ncbi:MAG: SdpI family protein [Firmicutes bacterium]|jgi:hypothetical protein|nr:SdpI family protein [Bacillota bacterium]
MWFWYFMMATVLLIPGAMIGFGAAFMRRSPKKINSIYGYRTAMSMKNKETWDFAHRYSGRFWFRTGWIVLVISVLAVVPLQGKDTDTIGLVGGLICVLQCIPMLWVVYATERALKSHFDKDGKRRK